MKSFLFVRPYTIVHGLLHIGTLTLCLNEFAVKKIGLNKTFWFNFEFNSNKKRFIIVLHNVISFIIFIIYIIENLF